MEISERHQVANSGSSHKGELDDDGSDLVPRGSDGPTIPTHELLIALIPQVVTTYTPK